MHVPQTEVILRHHEAELVRATLPPGKYVIGRSPEVAIYAETPLLSRRHAQLTIEYDQLFLQDLGSANGTFVNEQPVAEITRLYPNQPIRLGPDLTLEVRRQRAPTEPGVSLGPAQAAIRRFLPEEILAEKRYAIGGQIARGGMGAILDARQNATQRTVAMKVMLGAGGESDVRRFIEEAQVTAQLDHPNIVPIYELGVDEQEQLFYTMKLVRGITLKKVLALLAGGTAATVKKYPLPALLTIFQKVCDAVAFAHAKGVLHRDLKPENIMLGDFGSVLVMDWGLAKVLGKEVAPAASNARSLVVSARTAQGDSSRTLDGTIMGTPAYMSPEQARGEVATLDARSDLYALGAILFELLHLRPAVTGRKAMEIVSKVQQGQVEWAGPSPKDRPVPASLVAVCRKALAVDKAERYPSVEDLQRDLAAYQGGFATSAENAGLGKQLILALKRHKIAAAGAAAVLLVSATIGTKAVLEGRRAERAIVGLRKAAPILAAQADTLIQNQKMDEALEKVGFALAIAPQNPDFLLQRAHYLQADARLPEAIDAYRRVLAVRPGDPSATLNLALSEKLAGQSRADAPAALRQLYDALRAQGRTMESVPLGQRLGLSSQATVDAIEGAFAEWMRLPNWKKNDGPRIGRRRDGTYALRLHDLPIHDLAPLRKLRGLPVAYVSLNQTSVSDLAPLSGLPLVELWIENTPVSDLSACAALKLVKLRITNTNVTSLEPLRGMPLEDLDVSGCPVSDLSPLRGMPLMRLAIRGTKVDSLASLAGTPLQFLSLSGSRVTDLSPLRGLPLKSLEMDLTPVSFLDPLRGLPLERFTAWNVTSFTDIEALRGAPLKAVQLSGCDRIRDLAPLADCPELVEALIPKNRPGLELLRQHPKLRLINWGYPPKPAAQFWAEYDAEQAAGKK